jgi:hypothetical protein
MDQPSWQQRAQAEEARDLARMEQLGRAEGRRNDLNFLYGGYSDADGRAGLPGALRWDVYLLIASLVLGLLGFVLAVLRHPPAPPPAP